MNSKDSPFSALYNNIVLFCTTLSFNYEIILLTTKKHSAKS